jgi:hypothetical protein
MAGCTLVPDPDDELDGQHVDYQYTPALQLHTPAQGQEEQSQDQDDLNDSYQEMIQADRSVIYQGHRRARGYPRLGQPAEERLFAGQHYRQRLDQPSEEDLSGVFQTSNRYPRTGQPSEEQRSPHYEPRVIQTSNFQSRDWVLGTPESPEPQDQLEVMQPQEREVVQPQELEVVQPRDVGPEPHTEWPAYVPVPTRSPPGYRRVSKVRFAEGTSVGHWTPTETVPTGGSAPKSPQLPGRWAAWMEKERETTAAAQAESTVSLLTSRAGKLGQADTKECPDAAKGRIYYAIRLGERKLAQTCLNHVCGLTGATKFPYEAYDKLTTPTYHVRTMAESMRSQGLDYNHGALFTLSCARHFNMVTYANFGKAELDDVLELCDEKEIMASIRSEGQCVVAVLPYGDVEWKKLFTKNITLASPKKLDRAQAFTMIIVRAPNGAIYRQQCNYEGHGPYTGFALP